MKFLTEGSISLQVFGYVISAFGLSGWALDYLSRYLYSYPQNMGIVLGNGTIVLLGCVTLTAARCIKNLQRRVDLLESNTRNARR